MTLKIPPPPQFAGTQWQQLNRWLIEMQSILNSTGGIDPSSVAGLSEVIAQSAANAAAITTLEGETGGNTGDITALQGEVTTLQGNVTTINGQLTTLGARAQVWNGVGVPNAGLGNVNDWYANIGGAAGARVYVKTAVGTWTAFPF